MRYTKSWLIIMLALSLVLSACNFGQEPEPTPDVDAIFTAAAETVMAEFSLELTQTALAAPTATQPPTNTAPPTFEIVSPGAGSPAAPGNNPDCHLWNRNTSCLPGASANHYLSGRSGYPSWPGMHELGIHCRCNLP
jgi:hypothetical protein